MLWAIIMAGGSGTRFWPESRKKRPKQFLRLTGNQSLIKKTVLRLSPVVSRSKIVVVTSQQTVALTHKETGLARTQILGEPVGRNTAPCAILAAYRALQKDKNAVMALFPADHEIEKKSIFQTKLKQAFKLALESEMPVTFGVKPNFAHTGYGYLEKGKRFSNKFVKDAYLLKSFREKPTRAKAQTYFKSGRFLWNSGMFVWKASSLIQVAEKYLPEAVKISRKILKNPDRPSMNPNFSKMPNISIDYGLMEPLKGKILTLPVDFGWNDVGGWINAASMWKKDRQGNALRANALAIESNGNIVKSSSDKLVALLGMENIVFVETDDAILICPKDKAENVRDVVASLKSRSFHHRYL